MVASFYDLFDKARDDPTPVVPAQPYNGTDSPYALAALRDHCNDLAGLPQDSRRNDTLNRAAFKMAQHVAGGSISLTTVVSHLTAAARQSGLSQGEIDTVLRDYGAMAAGQQHPRLIPQRDNHPIRRMIGSSEEPPDDGYHDDPDPGEEPQPVEHTSWWPRDLARILAGDEPEQPPTHLTRADGALLFYPGSVNGLLGESESGKSWVAQMLVAQQLAAGRLVAYLDFEDVAKNVVARLRALGATDDQLNNHFRYINPEETLHQQAAAELQITLTAGPDTVIVDGFNAAMTLLGLDLQSNVEVTRFFQTFLQPLAATGACVAYIDHVPKDKENRGKGGIGAQAKRAMTSGTALLVEVVKPFGRGMRGLLSLTIDKDRPGHVRGNSGGARAGMVHIDSSSDGSNVTMTIEAPESREIGDGKTAAFRPTVLMQRVSQFLETVPGGASKNAIENGVIGKATGIRIALDRLVEEGYALREVAGGQVTTKIVRAFREVNDAPETPTSSPSSPPRPASSRDEAYETSSPSSLTPSEAGVTRDEDEGGPDEPWLPTSSPSPGVDRHTGEIT